MSEQRYYVTETQLTNIADAIREKKGTTSKILIDNMPSEIRGIEGFPNVIKLGHTDYERTKYQTSCSSVRVNFSGFTDLDDLYDTYGPGVLFIINKCVLDSDPIEKSIPYDFGMYEVPVYHPTDRASNRGVTCLVKYKDDYSGDGRQYGNIMAQVSMASTAYEWQAIQIANDPVTYFPKGNYTSIFYYITET